MIYIKADQKDKETPFYGLKNNTLTYEGAGWTKPGTKAYSLKDNGNGYIFVDHHLNAKTSLDYSQIEALKILLSK